MLPPAVVEEVRMSRLALGTRSAASLLSWSFQEVNVMQSDIVGFTKCGAGTRTPR